MAASLPSPHLGQHYCAPIYHQFCAPQNTYVFQEKEDGGLVLKIFNVSKKRIFKKELELEDVNLFSSSAEKIDVSSILPRHQHNCLEILRILANKHILPPNEEEEILSFQSLQAAPSIPLQPQVPEMAFGKANWGKMGVLVNDEPPLPVNIHEMLAAPSKIDPSQSVADTDILVLIPPNISLNSLKLLSGIECNFYPGRFEDLDRSSQGSYWVLMTRNLLPNSVQKPYSEQIQLLSDLRSRTGANYQVPSFLEASICMMALAAKTHELFPGPTNCIEPHGNHKYQYQVRYNEHGLYVTGGDALWDLGIAGLLKL